MKNQTRIPALALGLTLAAGLGAAAALSAAEQVRSFQQPFPGKGEVRLANLAGHVELVKGTGPGMVVDATVHGDFGSTSETARQIQGLRWVKGYDKKGREEWQLSYPVDKYRSYSYPVGKNEVELPSFLSFLGDLGNTTTTYRGERVKIYHRKGSAPTLYVDLRIALPTGSNLAIRNSVGKVNGGDLEGTLSIDTGSGDVQLASQSGQLGIDTGSGDVVVGAVRGEPDRRGRADAAAAAGHQGDFAVERHVFSVRWGMRTSLIEAGAEHLGWRLSAFTLWLHIAHDRELNVTNCRTGERGTVGETRCCKHKGW